MVFTYIPSSDCEFQEGDHLQSSLYAGADAWEDVKQHRINEEDYLFDTSVALQEGERHYGLGGNSHAAAVSSGCFEDDWSHSSSMTRLRGYESSSLFYNEDEHDLLQGRDKSSSLSLCSYEAHHVVGDPFATSREERDWFAIMQPQATDNYNNNTFHMPQTENTPQQQQFTSARPTSQTWNSKMSYSKKFTVKANKFDAAKEFERILNETSLNVSPLTTMPMTAAAAATPSSTNYYQLFLENQARQRFDGKQAIPTASSSVIRMMSDPKDQNRPIFNYSQPVAIEELVEEEAEDDEEELLIEAPPRLQPACEAAAAVVQHANSEVCNRKNVVKNLMCALRSFLLTPGELGYSEESLKGAVEAYNSSGCTSAEQVDFPQLQRRFKRYMRQKKFNHQTLSLLISHTQYSLVLRYFLNGPVRHWIKESKVVDTRSHLIVIEYLQNSFDSQTQLARFFNKKPLLFK